MTGPPGSLPPFDPSRRGQIVHCGGRTRIGGLAPTGDHKPSAKPTGASLIRLAYRTSRATDAAPSDAVAGALFVLPDRLRDPEVLVVVAHGTTGFAERCAPSRATGPNPSARRFASEGWMTIFPDYAGYGYGARASGWMSADDEASSIFDAIRAVDRLMPEGHRPKRVVLLGQSQGGHAVLAAQARARAENLPGEIVAVVAGAPMWFPPRLFARMITRDEPRADAGTRDLLWALYYFYGHAELEDGEGRGLDVIAPSLREPLGHALKTGCSAEVEEVLKDHRPSEVFAAELVAALRICDEGARARPRRRAG